MPRAGTRARAITALAVVAFVLQAARADAQGWTPPVAVGSSNLNYMYANHVSTALSAHPLAQAVTVWTEPSTMTVKYAVQRNGTWTGSKNLYKSKASASEVVTDAVVVIDAAGTATAVFGSTKQGPMQYCNVGMRIYRCPVFISYAKVATLLPGATAWTIASLSDRGVAVDGVTVGLDGAGNAVAQWILKPATAAVPVLQSASRVQGGTWSVPFAVPAPAGFQAPRLAVGASGHAMATWTVAQPGVPASYLVQAASLTPAATAWGAAETVAVVASRVWDVRCALDGSGRASVAWNDAGRVVLVRGAPGSWGAPEELGVAPTLGPDLATDAQGNAVVTWLQLGGAPDGGDTVEAARLGADGVVSRASWGAGVGGGMAAPSVAVTPDGARAVVAWFDGSDYNTYAAAFVPASGWDAAVAVSRGASQGRSAWGMDVSLAAAADGRVAATWLSAGSTLYSLRILTAIHQP